MSMALWGCVAAPGGRVGPAPVTPGGVDRAPDIHWVSMAPGRFWLGKDDGFADSRPRHEVTVPGFEIMATEVTVGMFRACVDAGACQDFGVSMEPACTWSRGDPMAPMNCVSWFGARDFCAWAGGSLPSEAQWEYAARSLGREVTFPWGEEAATCERAVMSGPGDGEEPGPGCGTGVPMAVCSKPRGDTAQGLCDMAGNLYEWVEDCWQVGYQGAPADGSARTRCTGELAFQKVIRGGSYLTSSQTPLQVSTRTSGVPGAHEPGYGFRCVRRPGER